MSEQPTGAKRYGTGGGDAYYDAVKYGGYTGTREQFGKDQANFAENAAAVAEAKEAVEQDKDEVQAAVQTFTEETVPAAVQTVEDAGDAQVERVTTEGTEQAQAVETVGGQQEQRVIDQGDAQVARLVAEGDTQVARIQAAGSVEVEAIEALKAQLDQSVEDAEDAKEALDGSITAAGQQKTALDGSISNAGTSKTQLDQSIQDAGTAKTNLEGAITNAGTAQSDLQDVIDAVPAVKSDLQGVIDDGVDLKDDLTEVNQTASQNITDLANKNAEATTKEAALRDALADGDEILTGVEDIKAYIGYPDEEIVGIQADWENKTFKRLAGAYGLTPGMDFDQYPMFGGRRRCNVADDGTINAYYGDAGYVEDGSNGQVMVYQPKFYYKVVPLKLESQADGIGYHLRKANYYISTKAKEGFKLHPAFKDVNGNEVDYILLPAFEGCLYDTSVGAYITDDAQVGDFTTTTGDKLSSIAGVKPASGNTQQLTRPNVERAAQNRGSNWHGYTIQIASANQLLMLVELGMANTQTAVGQGVVSYASGSGSEASNTGATSDLGNGTGQATQTTHVASDGTVTVDTTAGKLSVSYRGMENPWGNIWDFVYGINIHGNGNQKGGIPYICTDFNFAESKNSGNYESAGFTITNANGYISAFGYGNEDYDWLFVASECAGNSSLPVGDYAYITANLNGYRVARFGGFWDGGAVAGGFCWTLSTGVGTRSRSLGGRPVYVPTAPAA